MLRSRHHDDDPAWRAGTTAEAAASAAEREELRLIAAIADGQRPAFDSLYRAYQPRLARFLERMTRRPALVDEVLDDTMLVVWTRAARFNGTCKVSTWIFGIAYRKALKALHRLDEAVDDPEREQRADAAPGPEQRLGERQMKALLARALQALSAPHRAVVDLSYFHGMGYREIADIVDCPVDTVKTRMFHARRRLKVLLAGALGEAL